jgi:hypothetical protein
MQRRRGFTTPVGWGKSGVRREREEEKSNAETRRAPSFAEQKGGAKGMAGRRAEVTAESLGAAMILVGGGGSDSGRFG